MYEAIAITPNEHTVDLGCLLAIARAGACRQEQTTMNPPVLALLFAASQLGVCVAIYEVNERQKDACKKGVKNFEGSDREGLSNGF